MRLQDMDPGTPAPFVVSSAQSTPDDASAMERDALYCEVFTQLVHVSAVVEKALAACSQPPTFDDNPFLDYLGGRKTYTGGQDSSRLQEIDEALDVWVKYGMCWT